MTKNFYEQLSRVYCFLRGDKRFVELDNAKPRLFWNTEELHTYQNQRLLSLISWAYQTVDAYREKLNELGIVPGKIILPDQLSLLPILDRKKLQTELEKYSSRGIPPHLRKSVSTGGTTGEPVSIWWDKKGFQEAVGVQYRTYDIVGAGYGTKWLKIVGGMRHTNEGKGIRGSCENFFSNRRVIHSFEVNESIIDNWIKQIQNYKPDIIFGYGGHIQLLGNFLRQHPQELGIKAVLFGGEELPDYRSYEEFFRCPVVQTYATREVGIIAFECRARNLHIAEDVVFIENQRLDNQDTSKILVTSLVNRATPLIRYDLGDCGQILPADCPCGSSFRRLSFDIGRSPKYFELANGRKVSNLFFIHVIKDFPVAKYQFVISDRKKIIINILPVNKSDNLYWTKQLIDRIQAQLGTGISLSVRQSSEWISSPTGKILPVIETSRVIE